MWSIDEITKDHKDLDDPATAKMKRDAAQKEYEKKVMVANKVQDILEKKIPAAADELNIKATLVQGLYYDRPGRELNKSAPRELFTDEDRASALREAEQKVDREIKEKLKQEQDEAALRNKEALEREQQKDREAIEARAELDRKRLNEIREREKAKEAAKKAEQERWNALSANQKAKEWLSSAEGREGLKTAGIITAEVIATVALIAAIATTPYASAVYVVRYRTVAQ